MPVLTKITPPKTASFHDPVINTTTIAVKIIALNKVKTLARIISATEREVLLAVTFTLPLDTASSTCSLSNPHSFTSGRSILDIESASDLSQFVFECLRILSTIYNHFP